MGEQIISSVVTVMVAIVGLAIIATLVGKNAQTASVIGATGRSFSGALQAAEAPVLGGFGGLNVTGTSSYSGFQM
jgi:hypothetical protein